MISTIIHDTPSLALHGAAKLIAAGHWTQGAAVAGGSYCMIQAVAECGGDSGIIEALEFIMTELGVEIPEDIAEWNDAPERTNLEVAEALIRAADRAKKAGQ